MHSSHVGINVDMRVARTGPSLLCKHTSGNLSLLTLRPRQMSLLFPMVITQLPLNVRAQISLTTAKLKVSLFNKNCFVIHYIIFVKL